MEPTAFWTRSGSRAESFAGTITDSKDRSLVHRTNWVRTMYSIVAYQSPRTVVGAWNPTVGSNGSRRSKR
jgi:hypothetical protein